MTLSYSDGIVLALAKHTRLNATQLATKISHNHKNTKDLLAYMTRSGKVKQSAHTLNGERAYELTTEGAKVAIKLTPDDTATEQHTHTPPREAFHVPPPSKTTPPPDEQRIQVAPLLIKPATSEAPTRTINDMVTERVDPTHKFGLLNTGELILISTHYRPTISYTTTLSAKDTEALRLTLGAAS